jgi:hypothetical protein
MTGWIIKEIEPITLDGKRPKRTPPGWGVENVIDTPIKAQLPDAIF